MIFLMMLLLQANPQICTVYDQDGNAQGPCSEHPRIKAAVAATVAIQFDKEADTGYMLVEGGQTGKRDGCVALYIWFKDATHYQRIKWCVREIEYCNYETAIFSILSSIWSNPEKVHDCASSGGKLETVRKVEQTYEEIGIYEFR